MQEWTIEMVVDMKGMMYNPDNQGSEAYQDGQPPAYIPAAAPNVFARPIVSRI